MRCRRRVATVVLASIAAIGAAGCSPSLDWCEFIPEGSGIHVMFPCRPDRNARTVTIADAPLEMQLLACSAGDATFALAFFDVAEPARVSAAIADLRRVAARNVQADRVQTGPASVGGMTPNAQAARVMLDGKRPDGSPLFEEAVFFSHGLRVYQATVIGPRRSLLPTSPFFDALRLIS